MAEWCFCLTSPLVSQGTAEPRLRSSTQCYRSAEPRVAACTRPRSELEPKARHCFDRCHQDRYVFKLAANLGIGRSRRGESAAYGLIGQTNFTSGIGAEYVPAGSLP